MHLQRQELVQPVNMHSLGPGITNLLILKTWLADVIVVNVDKKLMLC